MYVPRVRHLTLVALVACGSAPAGPAIEHRGGAAAPDPVARDCWLGPDACELALDLDGDGALDRVELVRDEPCGASDDERACRQGLRLHLAAGAVILAGAGRAIAAVEGVDPELEPIPLDADLGFLVSIQARAGRPPCPAAALVISSEDAAAQVCVVAGEARAFHLGF
jgi:hypothetical protein